MIGRMTMEQQRALFFRALELAALETAGGSAGKAAATRDRWLSEAAAEGVDGFVQTWRLFDKANGS